MLSAYAVSHNCFRCSSPSLAAGFHRQQPGRMTSPSILRSRTVTVRRPAVYLYLFDRPILPLQTDRPVAIGKLTLEATTVDQATSGINISAMYIEGECKLTGRHTLCYTLDETISGSVTITVTAVDGAGNKAAVHRKLYVYNFALSDGDAADATPEMEDFCHQRNLRAVACCLTAPLLLLHGDDAGGNLGSML